RVGAELTGLAIPCPHVNLPGLSVAELGPIYSRCAAGLVRSFSNLSLPPLELLAAGTIPVLNDAANNRQVSDHPEIAYAPPVPAALAEAIIGILDDPERDARARRASASVASASWESAGRQVLDALETGMR